MRPENTERRRARRFSIGILLPAVTSLVVSAAAVLGLLFWSAYDVDMQAQAREASLIDSAMHHVVGAVPKEQETVSVWHAALENATFNFNAAWIDTNMATLMWEYFEHDDLIILNHHNRPIHFSTRGVPVALERADALMPTLAPLVARLRALIVAGGIRAYDSGVADYPPRVSDLANIGGRAVIIGVVPIIDDNRDDPQIDGTRHLYVSIIHLDTEYAARMAKLYQLDQLRFVNERERGGKLAHVPLINRLGVTIAYAQWQPALPGQALLSHAFSGLVVAFAIAGGVASFLLYLLWHNSRALDTGRADAEHKAAHDLLTGLANRSAFDAKLTHALDHHGEDGRTSVLMLDLDRFKQVNDTLGHHAGDELLRAASQRLSALMGTGDFLARLGGDEFAVICSGQPNSNWPQELSRLIIEALSTPFEIAEGEAFVGVSIGIATCDGIGFKAHELVRRADIALFEAKAGGRNRAMPFEESMNEFLQNRKTIEVELREAIRRDDQLEVHFQPLFDRDRNFVGAEALSRWTHPRLGSISPVHFIPVAEATGLIEALGARVLRAACEVGAKWPGHTFAVNISPTQLRSADFAKQIFTVIEETGMRPADLELEITEGILLDETSNAVETLANLRLAGIQIALDDFGTGYSSLNYLKRYPVDRIKIDRSFVSQLNAGGGASRAIVQAMVTLAHALQIEVTAEGVETSEQMHALRELGCNVYQGYLLSKPIPLATMEQKFRAPVPRVA